MKMTRRHALAAAGLAALAVPSKAFAQGDAYPWVHGNVRLSAPCVGTNFDNPNQVSIAPINGGGLRIKNPNTQAWEWVDFITYHHIEGDRTNAYLNGVPGQILQDDQFYYVGVKLVGGVPVVNFTQVGQKRHVDSWVEVFLNDDYTSLVGYAYPVDGSFLFDPLVGRSLTANWFSASANCFAIQAGAQPRLTVYTTSWAKLDPSGSLDLHAVVSGSGLFLVMVDGYGATDGEARLRISAYNSAGGLNGQSAVTAVSGVPKRSVSMSYGQPFAQDYYRFQIDAKLISGTYASFAVRPTALVLSA